MPSAPYPFSAVVGQDAMKTALLLAAVDPAIGGVLISGHKGTGKSTVVRALRALLPALEVVEGCPYHCSPEDPAGMEAGCLARLQAGERLPRASLATPLIELPLNATEDRLAGTLDVERALRDGQRRFEPGLLAAAHRGVLYVDEVNLLDDHLVDLLLDAAASGVNVVEREGVSYSHPARFALVGTMNPEEGSLRPQFLDRFALFVSVGSEESVQSRMEIARRRLAFEDDPARFLAAWAEAERELGARIVNARRALPSVALGEAPMELAVRLAVEAKARGHRAEIAIVKSARALAALAGRAAVGAGEIARAARLVLPHRMEAGPLDSPERLDARLADLIGRVVSGTPEPVAEPAAALDFEDDWGESMQVPGSMAASSITLVAEKKSPKTA